MRRCPTYGKPLLLLNAVLMDTGSFGRFTLYPLVEQHEPLAGFKAWGAGSAGGDVADSAGTTASFLADPG
jgi:hypothetical protein